ncbi:MAG: hypothetical protein ABIR83_01645 [Nakamurella sp.]
MKPRHALILTLAWAALAGCATTPEPVTDTRSGGPTGSPTFFRDAPARPNTDLDLPNLDITDLDVTDLDRADAGSVALRVVTALHEYDTRTNDSAETAVNRIAALLSPNLAAALASSTARPDSNRRDLERHDGYASAVAALANEYGQPAATATAAHVQVSVVVTLAGRDQWSRVLPTALIRVTLSAGPSGWRVEGLSA